MPVATPKRTRPTGNGKRGEPLLKDVAYAQIKRLILDGELPPGSFLSEQALADRVQVSKTPIRVALVQLQNDGLVSISPRQGIVVVPTSARDIAEMFDIRAAQETFLVRRLAGRLTPSQIDQLKENLKRHKDLAEQDDPVAATQNDFAFHLLLYEFLGNRMLLQFMKHVFDKLYRDAVQVTRNADGQLEKLHRDHDQIARALIKGDGELAAKRVLDHLEFGRRFLATHGH
jgi:DNA-binding GntR family transcriptional regulator